MVRPPFSAAMATGLTWPGALALKVLLGQDGAPAAFFR